MVSFAMMKCSHGAVQLWLLCPQWQLCCFILAIALMLAHKQQNGEDSAEQKQGVEPAVEELELQFASNSVSDDSPADQSNNRVILAELATKAWEACMKPIKGNAMKAATTFI